MVVITTTVGVASACAFGVAGSTAAFMAAESSSAPRPACDLEPGETLASHLPDLTAWDPVAGATAAAQVHRTSDPGTRPRLPPAVIGALTARARAPGDPGLGERGGEHGH